MTENANAPTTAGPAKPGKPAKSAKQGKSAPQGSKKQKKISPRQRRRRWLVSVLKPLAGKRFNSDKLSSFQVVMLGRALRSQVAECSFEYDATKLVAELQRTAGSLNRQMMKSCGKLCSSTKRQSARLPSQLGGTIFKSERRLDW